MNVLFVFFISLLSALFVLPKLSLVAHRIGLLDLPDQRKLHSQPSPLVGGMGIVMSATFASLLLIPIGGLRGYFAGLALLLFTGFFDDLNEVGHYRKFLAQITATGFLVYFSNIYLFNFGDLLGLGDIKVPNTTLAVWAVTIFCVVGVTNALNMIDGLDGLAGGLSLVAFTTFAILAYFEQSTGLVLLNVAFAGSVLGFLRYNWTPATMFMGDAGSLCLGFSLAFMSVVTTQAEGSGIPPVIPLLVLAIPISDTITVMTRRILRGGSPFKPDRLHLHYLLVDAGLSKTTAVLVIYIMTLAFAMIAVFGTVLDWAEYALFGCFLLYFTANFFAEPLLGRFLGKKIEV